MACCYVLNSVWGQPFTRYTRPVWAPSTLRWYARATRSATVPRRAAMEVVRGGDLERARLGLGAQSESESESEAGRRRGAAHARVGVERELNTVYSRLDGVVKLK